MTDKKKIDEAVTLQMSGTDEEGNTTTATIVADDVTELAEMLKRAGIAGNSMDFNGPASLTAENMIGGKGAVITTNAASLRAIMQMLEPEFAEVGDVDCGADCAGDLEGKMADDVAAQDQMAHMDAGADNDDMGDAVDATFDADGNLSLDTGEVEEDAEYDYRSHDVHPSEYPGKGSKTIVQPKTKRVPARSGDNPIAEAAPKSFIDYIREAEEQNNQ